MRPLVLRGVPVERVENPPLRVRVRADRENPLERRSDLAAPVNPPERSRDPGETQEQVLRQARVYQPVETTGQQIPAQPAMVNPDRELATSLDEARKRQECFARVGRVVQHADAVNEIEGLRS